MEIVRSSFEIYHLSVATANSNFYINIAGLRGSIEREAAVIQLVQKFLVGPNSGNHGVLGNP